MRKAETGYRKCGKCGEIKEEKDVLRYSFSIITTENNTLSLTGSKGLCSACLMEMRNIMGAYIPVIERAMLPGTDSGM